MTALIQHSTKIYEALDKEAVDETFGDNTIRVFRGSVVKLYKDAGISMGYYSNVFASLELNGCITRLQQGSRGVDTIIVLHHSPIKDEWTTDGIESPLTQDDALARLSRRVSDLEKAIGGMSIVEALANHEERLQGLEALRKGKADKA